MSDESSAPQPIVWLDTEDMVCLVDEPGMYLAVPRDAIDDMRERARSIPPQLLRTNSDGVPSLLYGLPVAQRVMAVLAGVGPRPENVNRKVVPTRRELRQAKKQARSNRKKQRGGPLNFAAYAVCWVTGIAAVCFLVESDHPNFAAAVLMATCLLSIESRRGG